MIVGYFHVKCIAVFPVKANPPLVIKEGIEKKFYSSAQGRVRHYGGDQVLWREAAIA
jgi:hypothetical protein